MQKTVEALETRDLRHLGGLNNCSVDSVSRPTSSYVQEIWQLLDVRMRAESANTDVICPEKLFKKSSSPY